MGPDAQGRSGSSRDADFSGGSNLGRAAIGLRSAEREHRAWGVEAAAQLWRARGKGSHVADPDRCAAEAEQGLQDCWAAPAAPGHAFEGEGRRRIRHRLPDARDEICGSLSVSDDWWK